MPTEQHMKAVLQTYIDEVSRGDAEAVTALFADDAVVEDPVGTEPRRGLAEIAAFYRETAAGRVRLSLVTPIRGSYANRAAMALTVEVPGDSPMRIRAIDVFTFGDDGLITAMQAYWGPSDAT
jgi:steroid delta-isomerase